MPSQHIRSSVPVAKGHPRPRLRRYRVNRQLTPAEERAICDLYTSGQSGYQITKTFKVDDALVTSDVVYHALRKHGVEPRPRGVFVGDDVELIRYERERGLLLRTLADHYGVTPTSIWRITKTEDTHAVD
jgi:hypothetical protein